ncbi:hypothetical protein CXG81DRAFT_27182 [Caulochytrium protostelioides]|uniref:Uncharacterized protein n=1 Tax=Caulochytrium protostelioides TaxID=1555241 RepID=A0A4P9X520_9FUNG|nr:hypothetical protein CXG81DRAFT_27182 [Caulochytrium protostelioides]|eukprot:RKP00110.1 hypothetical protein CXG81DRAFT_27182 [Caulochytrium protostelioides]
MTGTDYVLDAHDDASAAWLGTLPPVVVPFGPARLMELAYTVTARMAHLSPREAWALMLDHSLLAASLAVLGVLGNPGAAAPSAGPWDAAAASAAAGDAAALRLDAAESGGAAAMSPMTDFGAHGWDSADGAVASQTTHVQVSLDFAATILRQYGPPQNPADIEGQRQRLEGLTATWHYLQGEALILTEDSVAAAADHATADLGHATEGLVPWCLRRLQQRDREGALLGAHHDGHARYPRGHRGRPGDHPHSHPHPHLQPHRDRRTRAYVAALASDVLQLDHVLAHVLLPPADRHLVRVVRLVLRMTLIAYRDLADPDDPSRRARRTGFGEDLLATEDVLPDDLTSSTKTASTTATPNQAHDAWPPAPLDSQTLHTDGDAPVSPACPSAGASSPDEDDDQPPWDEDAATSRGSLTDEDDEDDTIALPASLAWQELVGLVTCHHAAHELVHPLSGALLWRALADVLGEGARPGQTFRMATVPDVAAVAQRLWRRSFCARGKLLYRAALAATALATAPPRPCFSPTRAPAAPPLLSTAVAVMLATLPALADQARAMGWAEAALAADVALAEAYVLAGVWPPSPPCGPPRHRAGVPLRALIAHPRWAPIAVRAQRAGRRDYVMRLLAACGAVAARSE